MAEPFERILRTTHDLAEKNFTDATLKHRPFLAMMQAKSKIKYDCTGHSPNWGIKFKNLPLNPYADAGQLDWIRSQQYKRAELEVRGYYISDIITEREKLMNRGPEQLINVYGEKSEDMKRDFMIRFPLELLRVDGSATGNENRFHGLPSIFGDDGGAVDGDEIVDNTDTYAGLSTTKGAFGGASGDSEFDFWSPVLINSGFNGGSWEANADERLRTGIQETTYANNATDSPDLVLCTKDKYRSLINLLDAKEQLYTDRGANESMAAKFGFQRVVEFDGTDVSWSFDAPDAAIGNATDFDAYILNFDYLELWLWHKNLCLAGSQWDPDQLSFKFWISIHGNMVVRSPRHQGIVQDYA